MHTKSTIDAKLAEALSMERDNAFKDGHYEALMQVHHMLERNGYDMGPRGTMGVDLRMLANALGTPINEAGEPVEAV